jgi:hypothetical protein
MKDSQIPVARKEGMVIQEMPNEVLVYDLETNKAHCLNQTAATIWKSCDGKNTVTDISRLLAKTSGSAVEEDLIWLAIDQLNEKNLLETHIAPKFNGQTRREVIKKVGLAAVIALPLISSLAAPKAAHAGSLCNTGDPCTSNAQCVNNGSCTCKGINANTGTGACG